MSGAFAAVILACKKETTITIGMMKAMPARFLEDLDLGFKVTTGIHIQMHMILIA
jgi:hypothetical protein